MSCSWSEIQVNKISAWTLTSTVCEAVEDVSLVAQALEAAGIVDAGVVAGPLKGALIDV